MLFFAALAAVLVAANLRFHLWFTLRFHLTEIRAQGSRVAAWIAAADWAFVLLLVSAAALIAQNRAMMATLLGTVGVISFLAFLIIEPATARAAFRRSRTRPQRPNPPRPAGPSTP